MNKKSLALISIALIMIGVGWGVHVLGSKPVENFGMQNAGNRVKIVNVDDVVRNPEKFESSSAGIIGVEGTATKVDEKNSAFTLGCEDACIMMPVKYVGRLPKEGTTVIAYGHVKQTEQAKYIFIAEEIQTK